MAIVDILENIQSALAQSSAIALYCAEKFGSEYEVWLGINLQNPPQKDSEHAAPTIIISNVDGSERNDTRGSWQIQIRLGVVDQEIMSDDKKKTYRGFVRCIELAQIIEDTILLLPYKTSVSSQTIPNEVFPLFEMKIVVNIDRITPMRGVSRKA